MGNTVLVTGAGFSAPAQMPVQADLMENVLERASKYKVRDTFTQIFNIFEVADMARVPLEDVFTVLDRANSAGDTLHGFSRSQLIASRSLLVESILQEFGRRLNACTPTPYVDFFDRLLQANAESSITGDAYSVITLNWDTLPDFAISQAGPVSYGCSPLPLLNESAGEPVRDRAFKLLKLHGSVHWLYCSSCSRLYFDSRTGETPPICEPKSGNCPCCDTTELAVELLMPTFLKSFSRPHMATIWHHALMELQQAHRIIFVGYSLPLADFEFRYLLIRALASRHDVVLRVVLYPPDSNLTVETRLDRDRTEQRYRSFFGSRDIAFKYMDTLDFMRDSDLLEYW